MTSTLLTLEGFYVSFQACLCPLGHTLQAELGYLMASHPTLTSHSVASQQEKSTCKNSVPLSISSSQNPMTEENLPWSVHASFK